MKIHELIERLQDLERVHGNVPVAMVDGQEILDVCPDTENNSEVIYLTDTNADGKTRKWWHTSVDDYEEDDDEEDDDEGEEWKKGKQTND